MSKAPTKSRASKKPPEFRRRFRPHPLGLAISSIARPIIGKRGFADVDIISRWGDIVGEDIATYTLPERITKSRSPMLEGGTLHVRVASSAFATVLKHKEPELCDRINGFFGFPAVAKFKTTLGKIPVLHINTPRPEPPPLTKDAAEMVETIDDLDLREALEKLGRSLLQKEEPKG